MDVEKLKALSKGTPTGLSIPQIRVANFQFKKMSAITKKRYILSKLYFH